MLRKFFGYFGGMIIHPGATLDELARESSIRFAVLLVILGLFITLVNVLLFTAFGYDWLGTRRELPNPTYIGFFGRLRVDTDHYVPIFNLLTGHPYAFTDAQTGQFGPLVQALWWFYMIGIYILAKDAWTVVLGTLAIHRVQKIPVWPARR